MPPHLKNTLQHLINTLGNLAQHDIVVLGIDDTLWHNPVDTYNGQQPILTHPGLPALLHYLQETKHPIILLTSREELYRQYTITQLQQAGLVYDVLLQAPDNKIEALLNYLDTEQDRLALSKRLHLFDNERMPIRAIKDLAFNKKIINHSFQPTTQCLINEDKVSPFPLTLNDIEQPVSLGGGTASTFKVSDSGHQQDYVLKFGSSEAQIKLEILANVLYKRLGVAVPHIQAYHALPDTLAKALHLPHTARVVQLAELLQAKAEQKEEGIIAKACQDFVVHAFLGNIDIAKTDNFIHADDDEIYLIDAGANFLFRALGERRVESSSQVNEIDSLRTNPVSRAWFKDISEQEIALQVKELMTKRHTIEETIWELSPQLKLPFSLQEQLLSGLSHRLDDLVTRYGFVNQAFAKRDKVAIEHKTAAGVMHLQRNAAGQLEVLLSKRVKHNWCDNFGGKSDAEDLSLAHTAQREAKEESNGILCYSDRELTAASFHDIITYDADHKTYLYRMYFVESLTPLDLSKLNDDEHTSHHWVTLAALQAAITANATIIEEDKKTIIVNDVNGAELILFPPLYEMLNQEPVKTLINYLLNPLARQFVQTAAHTQGIATEPDAYLEKRYRPLTSPQQVKTDLSHTLLHKSKMLDAIKQQSRHHFFKAADVRQLAPSEWHLKAIMANNFKDDAPIEHNVTLFLDNYQEVSFTDNDKRLFIAQAVEMINHERNRPDCVFFYHATNSNIAYAYQIYTTIYRMLAANRNVDIFRMDNLLFHSCLNIQAFISHFQSQSSYSEINNYEPGYMECALSTNLFLFGSHNIDNSYTIDYYKNNISQTQIDLTNMLVANLQSIGVSTDTITKLVKLIELFPHNNRGVLYQISLPREEAKNYAYPAAPVGRLNPFKTQEDEKCLDIAQLINILPDDLLYITSVQARLMVPPNAPIKTKAYSLSQSVNELSQQYFEQQLEQLAEDCVFDILKHRNQFNKLNAHTALMRYLPQIYQQAGLRDTGIDDINDDFLIDLLQARDFESIKIIVIALPKYRDKPLCSAKLSNQRFLLRNQSQTLLERLLAINGTGETIRAIYGDNFYEGKLDTLNFYQVVAAVPEKTQLEFLITYRDRVVPSNNFDKMLLNLPEASRLTVALQCQNAIQYCSDIMRILPILPNEAARVDFVIHYSDRIKTFSRCLEVLFYLPKKARFDVAVKYSSSSFMTFGNFTDISSILPKANRLAFAIACQNKIIHFGHLLEVLNILQMGERRKFATICLDKITNENEIDLVLEKLPKTDQLQFEAVCKDNIMVITSLGL